MDFNSFSDQTQINGKENKEDFVNSCVAHMILSLFWFNPELSAAEMRGYQPATRMSYICV